MAYDPATIIEEHEEHDEVREDCPLCNPIHCPVCGGSGHVLGVLRSRTHYRCRNCGMDFSQER